MRLPDGGVSDNAAACRGRESRASLTSTPLVSKSSDSELARLGAPVELVGNSALLCMHDPRTGVVLFLRAAVYPPTLLPPLFPTCYPYSNFDPVGSGLRSPYGSPPPPPLLPVIKGFQLGASGRLLAAPLGTPPCPAPPRPLLRRSQPLPLYDVPSLRIQT